MGNSKAIDDGFRLAKRLMADEISKRLDVRAMESVTAAQRMQEYGNATGNATTAYTMLRYDGRQRVSAEFKMGDYMKPPVFRKVRKGERKVLKPSYDGPKKSVWGKAELETQTTRQAVELVRRMALGRLPVLMTYRFAHPVEYEEYLARNGMLYPVEVIRQEVMARMRL